MSRIPPIATRIACGTRNYECSNISSYYYSDQLLSNFALIAGIKKLGMQLNFKLTSHKPNHPDLAIYGDLFPVHTTMKAKSTFKSQLEKGFYFDLKYYGFASTFLFNAIKSVYGMDQKRLFYSSDVINKKKNYLLLNSILKHNKNQYVKRIKAADKQAQSSFEYYPNSYKSLKLVYASRQIKPSNPINLFYLTCNMLVSQCNAFPKGNSQIIHNLKTIKSDQIDNKHCGLIAFESYSHYGQKNLNVGKQQSLTGPVGIPKCFISYNSMGSIAINLFLILPMSYVLSASNTYKNIEKKFETITNNNDKLCTIKFNMYDSELDNSSTKPISVRF